jgi:hypothetical protein
LQTEVVKLGYRITAAQKTLETCLDRKEALAFTLATLESPLSLDKNLLKDKPYEIAKDYRLVMLTTGTSSKQAKSSATAKDSLFKRLAWQNLFASRQAEARTIK